MDEIVVFRDGNVRRKFIDGRWFFSVVDVVGVLTGSLRPRKYWADLKNKLIEEGFQLSDFIGQLKLKSGDGKEYETDCADTEGIFRIIQSIPSKKAESFKRWLAKVGYERVQEIENPELAQERMKGLHEKKGYSKDWINKRLRALLGWDGSEIEYGLGMGLCRFLIGDFEGGVQLEIEVGSSSESSGGSSALLMRNSQPRAVKDLILPRVWIIKEDEGVFGYE